MRTLHVSLIIIAFMHIFIIGIFMFGMIYGWLDLIYQKGMVVGRQLMPHHRKLVMVNI